MVDQPLLYKPHPSLFPVMLLSGFTGTVLITALVRVTSSLGGEVVDLPQLMGGVFSADRGTAFTAGHALFLIAGVLVLPLLLALLWPFAPGDRFTFGGALVRGRSSGSLCSCSQGCSSRCSVSSAAHRRSPSSIQGRSALR